MKFGSVLWKLVGPRKPALRRRAALKLGLEALEDRWVPSTLTVGSGHPYATINAAYTAAHSGDTIEVFPGTYTESSTLALNKKVILTASVVNDSVEILAGSGLTGPIVDVGSGASGTVIKGFKIDGGGNAAGNIEAGVKLEAGVSATVRQDHITDLYNGTNNQTGYGIEDNGVANILLNTIDTYQKDGIIVDGSVASASVTSNAVTGTGTASSATPLVTQNGIQISDGAQANVSWNTVTGNSYNPNDSNYTATGILVYNDAACVVLGQNEVYGNELGGYLYAATNTVVTNNDFSCNFSVGGLLLQNCSNITISHNTVDTNGSDGIYVYDSTGVNILWDDSTGNSNNGNFTFQGHNILGIGNGIVIDGGSGNNIAFDAALINASNGLVLNNTTGNTITYSLAAFNVGDGILLLGAKGNTIHSNLVLANNGTGIYADSASTGNTIDNNVVADNGDGNYSQQLGVGGNNNTWQSALAISNAMGCAGLDDGSAY